MCADSSTTSNDFESVLIKKLGYIPNFYFTEHGDGNLVSAILDHSNFLSLQKYLLKSFVISSIQKFLFLLNLSFFSGNLNKKPIDTNKEVKVRQ